MKTVPATFLLAFIAGCGAFVHHVTDDTRRRVPPRIPEMKEQVRKSAEGMESMTRMAKEISGKSDAEICAAYHRRYSGLTGEDFARLALEMPVDYTSWRPPYLAEYWSAADAAGLLKFAEEHPDRMPPAAVLSMCAVHDPAAALAFLRRREAAKDRDVDELWKNVWSFANESKLQEILVMAEQDGILKTRPDRFRAFMASWARRDPEAALAFSGKHGVLLQSAIAGWADADPAAALNWMKDSGTATAQPALWQELILNYARSHPKEAASLRSEAKDPEAFDRGVMEGMVEQYPSEAVKLNFSGEEGNRLFNNLAYAMGRRPPAEAEAFLKGVPPDRQLAAFTAICGEMAWRDPRAAAGFCTRFPKLLGDPHFDPNNPPALIFERLAREDPQEAIAWMAPGKLPDAVRESALPQVVDAWMVTDRKAATRYVQSLPPSEMRGRMLLQSSRIPGEVDQEAAMHFVMNLTDTADRAGACRVLLGGLGDDATEAAKREWIAGIPDAAVRKVLLTPPPPEPAPPDAGSSGDDPLASPDADPFAVPDKTAPQLEK